MFVEHEKKRKISPKRKNDQHYHNVNTTNDKFNKQINKNLLRYFYYWFFLGF